MDISIYSCLYSEVSTILYQENKFSDIRWCTMPSYIINLLGGKNMLFFIGVSTCCAIGLIILSEKKRVYKVIGVTPMIIIVIVCIVVSFLILTNTHEEVETRTIPIVSLQDNSEVHGNINSYHNDMYGGVNYYITISTGGVYTYYYQVEDNAYKQETIEAKNTVIYEEDNCEEPLIITYTTYRKSDYGLKKEDADFLVFGCFGVGEKLSTRYEVHVPKGSVVQQFVLDSVN